MAWEGYSGSRSSPGVVGEGTAVGESEQWLATLQGQKRQPNGVACG